MKDCGDCRESILLNLDKSLSVSQVIEFRAHLKICEACRQAVEAEEELSHLWSFCLGVRRTDPSCTFSDNGHPQQHGQTMLPNNSNCHSDLIEIS